MKQGFTESKATNRRKALARSQKNILKHRRIFLMLVFFVVSGEKRITKQMFFVLCGYFFPEKVIVFENLRKALEPSSTAWLLMTHSIPVQSQNLCDQTEDRTGNMLLN